jgi:molybdopterin molybdotransferase
VRTRITVAEALAAIAEYRLRTTEAVTVPLHEAAGLTLAEDVAALEDVPPFARSRVDGYAVVCADVASASPANPVKLRLIGEVMMGAPAPSRVYAMTAVCIPTGGAMPDGADGAVMVEDTTREGDTIVVRDAEEARRNVTLAGADVAKGQPLFGAGTMLTPAKIGLLAGAGIAAVLVREPPVVGLLLTGDELTAPGEELLPGFVRDINRYSLGSAIDAMGCVSQQYDRVPDQKEAFVKAFERALEECDAVVISGGSSAGEADFTPEVIASAGKPGVIVHHIRAKPGRPTVLGVIGDKPIIGLPGNPVSALVMLETVGKPILLRMLGRTPDAVPCRAILSEPIDVSPQLEHRIPVRLSRVDGEVHAAPLLGTSAQMRILGFADALIVVPIGAGRLETGSVVEAFALSTSAAG